MTEAWEYRGRWALVTGASSGIGEGFARALAERGMNLVLTARREDRLREIAEQIGREYRIHTAVIAADLSRPGAADELWSQATDRRAVRLLVNNAGFGLKGEFHVLPASRQVEMVRLNCIAPLELCHIALREMRAAGEPSGIVNVASVAAFQPIPFLAAYAASKAFVLALSEAVAEESRAAGIRVVTLNPGPVRTGFQSVAGTHVTERTLGVRTVPQVVGAALQTLERGGGTVTPGLSNHVAGWLARAAPRGLAIRAAKAVMQKLR